MNANDNIDSDDSKIVATAGDEHIDNESGQKA